jgi:hypothetical protein
MLAKKCTTKHPACQTYPHPRMSAESLQMYELCSYHKSNARNSINQLMNGWEQACPNKTAWNIWKTVLCMTICTTSGKLYQPRTIKDMDSRDGQSVAILFIYNRQLPLCTTSRFLVQAYTHLIGYDPIILC